LTGSRETTSHRWWFIEDVIRATERALDEALWEGQDTTYLKRELAGLRAAQAVGEEYVTSW